MAERTSSILTTICRFGNAALLLFLGVYFFLVPGCIVIHDLTDPALSGPGMPAAAVRLHRTLTPKYARWARERIASGQAATLPTADISGTEWPLFGSAFYLWSTEALQDAWEKDPGLAKTAPRIYAREAIGAATDLVLDPHHATWVRDHWGKDYLKRENVFYRMLIIASLTSYHRLTGDDRPLKTLRGQVESLAAELDASEHGLLDDYPGECYPGDVVAAIACIRRADRVLGTDHSAFAARAIRGFQGALADAIGLPPYAADSRKGVARGPSRGCANSYVCLFAPELWPERAAAWYALYEEHFWQERWTAAGFREFPKGMKDTDWYMDVDSGPVLAGHGVAACAFGLGAARANGRFDHAYPLAAETLLTGWPLPHGTLVTPRLLSNAVDAPYLGEVGILFNLTRQPVGSAAVRAGGSVPTFVVLGLTAWFLASGVLILAAIYPVRRWRRRGSPCPPHPGVQSGIWLALLLAGTITAAWLHAMAGLLMLLAALLLPRGARPRETVDNEAGA